MLISNENSFHLIFGQDAEKNLVPIFLEDKQYMVPRTISLLRGLHYIASTTNEIEINLKKHCWAGSCENCKCNFVDAQLGIAEGLACQMDVEANLKLTRLPRTIKTKQNLNTGKQA